ncbi:ATP synthase F1 subunit epsilon [bacterium]|nr:ATP synthase F1 subunit epsilon [bacterium]
MAGEETLQLNVLCPERPPITGIGVKSVTLFGSEGQIQIMPGHAAMIGSLETGTFSYETAQGQEKSGVISSGFFEVSGNQVTVSAATLELDEEISLERAKAAQSKAENALMAMEIDEHQFKKYQLKLQRAIVRQQAVGKKLSS